MQESSEKGKEYAGTPSGKNYELIVVSALVSKMVNEVDVIVSVPIL